jgi:peptidoglycan/LPS O-acetylase OafA/YrhL
MRLEGIDILRGLAVSVVILYHFFELLGLHNSTYYPFVISIGQIGVPLFFVISGYLIYRSVDYSISNQSTKSGLKQYFIHRIFRILPAYYFNFLIIFILAFYIFNTMDTWSSTFIQKQIFSHLTFTSYFLYQTSGLGINGAYWTLSIEMLWYILAPLLFLYLKKDRYFFILFILAFLYLWCIDLGLFDFIFNLDKSASNYMAKLFFFSFQLPGQMIYFIAGIYIYKYSIGQYPMIPLLQYILFIFIIGIFIFLSNQRFFLESFLIKNIFTLLAVASLFIIFYRHKRTELHFLAWIGKISYSLYLWHMPLLFLMKLFMPLKDFSLLQITVVFLILLFIISSLSYYFIEEYGFTLRKKFENSQILKPRK